MFILITPRGYSGWGVEAPTWRGSYRWPGVDTPRIVSRSGERMANRMWIYGRVGRVVRRYVMYRMSEGRRGCTFYRNETCSFCVRIHKVRRWKDTCRKWG